MLIKYRIFIFRKLFLMGTLRLATKTLSAPWKTRSDIEEGTVVIILVLGQCHRYLQPIKRNYYNTSIPEIPGTEWNQKYVWIKRKAKTFINFYYIAKYGTWIIYLLKTFSAHTISYFRCDPQKTTLWLKPNANLHWEKKIMRFKVGSCFTAPLIQH